MYVCARLYTYAHTWEGRIKELSIDNYFSATSKEKKNRRKENRKEK